MSGVMLHGNIGRLSLRPEAGHAAGKCRFLALALVPDRQYLNMPGIEFIPGYIAKFRAHDNNVLAYYCQLSKLEWCPMDRHHIRLAADIWEDIFCFIAREFKAEVYFERIDERIFPDNILRWVKVSLSFQVPIKNPERLFQSICRKVNKHLRQRMSAMNKTLL